MAFSLKASHNHIADEKADPAKELAVKSSEEAQKAIDKSLPLLSADSLAETKQVYAEAELLYAEKYAADPFAGAGKLIGEAESQHEKKEFWDAHLKSKEGLALAAEARDISLCNVPAVKEEIAGLEDEGGGYLPWPGALDFPGEIIESIAPGSSSLYVLTIGSDLVKVGTSGGITETKNIALAGWGPFKVLADQFNNVYVLYAKDGSGFTLRKWDGMGSMTGEITGMAGGTISDARLAYNAIYITSYSWGSISVEKYDLTLAFQWSYSENITGPAFFVSKLDLFGNSLWRKGMNGAAASVFPAPNGYYLESSIVLPVVRAGLDSKAYVLSAPGLSVRTVNGDGDFEKTRSLPVYSGSAYYRDMFIHPSGNMSIYGSTDGKISPGNSSFGALDWFYLETDNY